MKLGRARITSVGDANPRTYPDGKTTSRAMFGYKDWEIQTPERIDSKAFFSCGVLQLPEQAEIAAHCHSGREEIYFVLEGTGEVNADGEYAVVQPGMAIWFPAGTVHRVFNPNKESLKMFFATAVTDSGNMKHD